MELTTNTRIEQQSFSNRSYNVSQTAIQGFVTDLEALSQSIHKRLSTQQFEYPVYSFRIWCGLERSSWPGSGVCSARDEADDSGNASGG